MARIIFYCPIVQNLILPRGRLLDLAPVLFLAFPFRYNQPEEEVQEIPGGRGGGVPPGEI